jgi:hypothetical protein
MTTQSKEIFSVLEKDLERSLRPVQPNQEFVSRLHTRLAHPTTTVLERATEGSLAAPIAFVVGFGLAVGLLVVWVIRQLR